MSSKYKSSWIFGIFLLIFLLAGCQSASESNWTDEASMEDSSSQSQQVFETSLDKNSEGYAVTCYPARNGSKYCTIDYSVKNISNIPQDFDGDEFVLTGEGKVYQATRSIGSPYWKLNPDEVRHRSSSFELPVGTLIVSLFKAYSATDTPYYTVDVNVQLGND